MPTATLETLKMAVAVCPNCGAKRSFYDVPESTGLRPFSGVNGGEGADATDKWDVRKMVCACATEFDVPEIP